MHHPTDRIAHTTAFVTQVMEHWLEREITRVKDRTDGERRNSLLLLCVLLFPIQLGFNMHVPSKLLQHVCNGHTLQLSAGLSV